MGAVCCGEDIPKIVALTPPIPNEFEKAFAQEREVTDTEIAKTLETARYQLEAEESEAAKRVKEVEKAVAEVQARAKKIAFIAKQEAEAFEASKKEQAAKKEAEMIKPAKKEDPAMQDLGNTLAAACEFKIQLKKDAVDDKLGCKILRSKEDDGESGNIVISAPCGKVMEEWQNNNPTKKVLPGDEIVSVCGCTGKALALLDAISKHMELDIVLRRRLQFVLEVTKEGSFGLTFDESTCKVVEIGEGPIQDYNLNAKPNMVVYIGDQLCQLNDMELAPDNLASQLDSFKDGDKIKFTFKRPPVE